MGYSEGVNQATKKGPDTSTIGATCWFTKPRPSVTRSPGPKGSSAQLPTPPGIALSEPSQEQPLVDTYHFSPVREVLFNTLSEYVHRGQKDSVIGTQTTYALGNSNHLDQIYQTNQAGRLLVPNRPKNSHARKGHQLSPKKGEIRSLLLTETSDLILW